MTPNIALSLLLSLWLLGHILVFGLLSRRTNYFSVFVSLLILTAVYATKPATFDLPRYSVYFETGIPPWITSAYQKKEGWKLEDLTEVEQREYLSSAFFRNSPAFTFLIDLTRPILPHGSFLPRIIRDRHVSDSLVLLVGILGLALLSTALSLLYSQVAQSRSKAYFYGVLVLGILGSVFFFVGSQNAIRQFVGTCFSVLVFAAVVQKKYGLASVSFILSFLFHPWSPVFAITSVLFWKAKQIFEVFRSSKIRKIVINEYVLAIILGVGSVVAIKIGIKLGLPYFTTYFHMDTSKELFRTAAPIKLALIGAVLIFTEIISGRSNREKHLDPRSLRLCFFLFLTPLVIYPEIVSRLLMFYFASELIFLIWALGHTTKRVRLSGCVVFLSYAVALNALNILLDKDWLEIMLHG